MIGKLIKCLGVSMGGDNRVLTGVARANLGPAALDHGL